MPLTKARQRGLHPERGEPTYLGDVVDLTVKLPVPLWQWLKEAVGTTSQTYSVEETIITALRCLAGPQADLGTIGAGFLVMAADCRNVSVAEATFGPMDAEAERQVGILLEAARAVTRGPASFTRLSDDEDDPAETAAVLKAWSAAAGTDMAAVIEQERQQQDEADRKMAEEFAADAELQKSGSSRPLSETLDDNIPY